MSLETLFRSLVRVQIGLWEDVDRALRDELDVTLVRYLPMRVVADTPECRVQDVARSLRITTGGATQAVDRIAAAGLVVRRPNPNDRRSSILELTSDGEALLGRAAKTVHDALRARTDGLSPASLDGLQRALTALDTAPAPPGGQDRRRA